MKLIDSHCHLKPFYEKGELDNILSNANKTGVFKMLTVGTHSEDWLTYKDLAVAIGRPNSSRAVANACGKNPYAPIIPCHRVVRSDGKLGGYSGDGGIATKKRLLEEEKK